MREQILIVEDNYTVGLTLQHLCKKLDFDCDLVTTLADLRQILKSGKSYLTAIVDYDLPDAPKGEAIDEVTDFDIAPVVFTGVTDDEVREQILRRAVVDYVPKETVQAFHYLAKAITRLKKNRNIGLLIVDDQRSSRNYLATLLKRHNFIIYEAKDGKDGLEVLQQHPEIKLVLTDHNMPVMTGLEFTNEIRRKYGMEEIAIIGISSETNKALTAKFIKNGANDFIPRPFYQEELFCRININIEYLEQVAEINHRANTDFLTQLYNRRYFFEQAPKLLKAAKDSNRPLCVAMLDIDYFKVINDTHGHDAGDLAIQNAAQMITDMLPEALCARFGGEEFCVLLADTDLNMATGLMEEIRQKTEDMEFSWEGAAICYTLSIGVAELGDKSLEELVSQADHNLYDAKTSGRNKVVA